VYASYLHFIILFICLPQASCLTAAVLLFYYAMLNYLYSKACHEDFIVDLSTIVVCACLYIHSRMHTVDSNASDHLYKVFCVHKFHSSHKMYTPVLQHWQFGHLGIRKSTRSVKIVSDEVLVTVLMISV